MAKKKRRPPKRRARRRSVQTHGDWGYYLYQDAGISVAYAAKASDDGSVEAALFGMDTWRDGLIVCCGRRFQTKEAFQEAAQQRSGLIKPASRMRCQEEVACGLRIRQSAEAELPTEFDQWRHLVDPLEDLRLPSYLYRCPGCGRGLPEEIAEMINDGVDGEMMFYMLCDHCKRPGHRPRSAEHAGAKHVEAVAALEEIEEFSFTWDQDYLPPITRIPVNPNVEEVVRMLLGKGDPMEAACMAIETYIACAAVPNPIVEDRHILDALQAVIAGELRVEDEDAEVDPTEFLVGAIKDGIQMFNEAMRRRGQMRPHALSALKRIMESVDNHHSNKNPRSYIQFIKRFVPV